MPNIKFIYRYRCSGNYKKHGSIVFANPTNIELSIIEEIINSKLIYGEYFYAADWQISEIFTDIVDFRIDPSRYEFENIEYTNEQAIRNLKIVALISLIK